MDGPEVEVTDGPKVDEVHIYRRLLPQLVVIDLLLCVGLAVEAVAMVAERFLGSEVWPFALVIWIVIGVVLALQVAIFLQRGMDLWREMEEGRKEEEAATAAAMLRWRRWRG